MISLLVIGYSFFIDWNAGLAFPFKSVAQDKKNSLVVSLGLGILEFDYFSAGANLLAFPQINLFSLDTSVAMRFDSESFLISLGAGLGPAISFEDKKNFANLYLGTNLKIGTYIVPRRFSAYISPVFGGYIGPRGGYILSLSFGFSLISL